MIQHNIINDLVFNAIKENASENNPISQTAIQNKLCENPENKCDRKTVGRALERLREKYGKDEAGKWNDNYTHLHFKVINRSTAPIYTDYWFSFVYDDEDDDFSVDELMFLMDAVQFSKHIDKKHAEEISGKLANLSRQRFNGVFEMHTKINEKNTPVNLEFFKNIGDIDEAARIQRMISFNLCKYGVDKKLYPVEHLEVCPYKIIVSDGYYFLLCARRNSEMIRSYRIDKIKDIVILNETFPHNVERVFAAFHANEYIFEHRYMNPGETLEVTINVDRSILDDVIDSFGTKIKIDPAAEDANRLVVHVKSSERDIVDWVMRYRENAVILRPDYLRKEIKEMANLLHNVYSEKDNDLEYTQIIEKSWRFGNLILDNIDLNCRESYKELTEIRRAVFRCNGIRDFSFLNSYLRLTELTISHNEISDPSVLSELRGLIFLGLEMTGIKNLDFLSGLERLTWLSINEYTIEDVEALYSLPRLRFLTVSKAVSRLIDKSRLRTVFGDSLEYKVDNRVGRTPLSMMDAGLPRRSYRPLRRDAEVMEAFSTFEVTDADIKAALVSQIYAGTRYGGDLQFDITDSSCFGNERYDLYTNLRRFAGEEFTWYVAYDGPAPEQTADIDPEKIYTISVFKPDHGLKLVFMAARNCFGLNRNDPRFVEIRNKTYPAMDAHIKYLLDNRIGWAELSGELENHFRRVGTMNNVRNPVELLNHHVIGSAEIDDDDYHFYRTVPGEKIPDKKIVYGHVESE